MQMPKWWLGVLAGALVGGPACSGPDTGAGPPEGLPEFQLELLTGPGHLGTGWKDLMVVQLCNRGGVPSSTEVGFYLSRDSLIDESDTFLASSQTTQVPAGSCRSVSAKAETPRVLEGTYYLGAIANPHHRVREGDERNNSYLGRTVRVDLTPPPVPVLAWLDPSGVSSPVPNLSAQSEPEASILLYRGDRCTGMAVANLTSGTSCPYPDGTPEYVVSSYSARAYDLAGNVSDCTSIPVPSGYGGPDTTPPAPPVLVEVDWRYGASQPSLRVTGTAEPRSEVAVFLDVTCTGVPAATVFAGASGAFSTTLTVAATGPGSLRKVYVAARDAALNESTCVQGPTYETPCAPGYANCDGNPANGCEVDLTADADHCGTCGTACTGQGNAQGVCVAGTCDEACPVGTYDCDGTRANGCESTTACGPAACTVSRMKELMLTSLPVVEDPTRTALGGAWHFETLMRAMAGGGDPSALVRQWLKTWNTPQTINGLTVPARPRMMTKVLGPWEERSGGPSQPLNFAHAPFRLLAIVNRIDLRQPGVQAGEGRFVFGVVDANGAPLEFTVILEYALPGLTPEAIQRWARDWHELGQLNLGSPEFKTKLQGLTDRFAKAGVLPGRPHGNALNQIRTNEVALSELWEMREFVLTTAGLQPATVKLTADTGFNNTNVLSHFIQANQQAILEERHTVPESFSGQRFLAASSKVPEDFFWRAPSVANEARHKFSLNTCNGCHAGETATEFTHISNRAAGQTAQLSLFLRGGTVQDPVTLLSRPFDDLGRREQDLKTLVCGTPGGSSLQGPALTFEALLGYPAPSNLPRARVH
jgi:hypothetical protein